MKKNFHFCPAEPLVSTKCEIWWPITYLKFLLDSLMYAGRMPKYHEALRKNILSPQRVGRESKLTGIERSITELNQSVIALLSFKTLSIEWVWIWIFEQFERKAANCLWMPRSSKQGNMDIDSALEGKSNWECNTTTWTIFTTSVLPKRLSQQNVFRF